MEESPTPTATRPEFGDVERTFFKAQFKLFDKDNNESIPVTDLGNALRMCGLNPFESDLKEIVEKADVNKTGIVTYGAFEDAIVACFSTHNTLDALKDAFRAFDPDNRGALTQSDLRFILTNLGDKFSDEEMNEFLQEAASEYDTEGAVLYDSLATKLMPEFLKS